jgi:hypothetical protein
MTVVRTRKYLLRVARRIFLLSSMLALALAFTVLAAMDALGLSDWAAGRGWLMTVALRLAVGSACGLLASAFSALFVKIEYSPDGDDGQE